MFASQCPTYKSLPSLGRPITHRKGASAMVKEGSKENGNVKPKEMHNTKVNVNFYYSWD